MKRISLKKARLIAEMTELEVCSALRIRKGQLLAWESGKTTPSIEHAAALADAYGLLIDMIDFSKEGNMQPEQQVARPLSLEEIKALPRTSVVWMIIHYTSDDGICWYSADPVMVSIPGDGGELIGGIKDEIINRTINDKLLDKDVSIWDREPTPEQAHGITEKEYNALDDPNDDYIKFPVLASAITSRGMTLDAFCKSIKLFPGRFWKCITGKSEFIQWEIVKIVTALQLNKDETQKIFFPDVIPQI